MEAGELEAEKSGSGWEWAMDLEKDGREKAKGKPGKVGWAAALGKKNDRLLFPSPQSLHFSTDKPDWASRVLTVNPDSPVGVR